MSTQIATYGLSNVDLKQLANIEAEMNTEYEKVENAQKHAFIKFGGLLDEARGLISDDQLFGEWRKERTPFESKENANKAMQLHRAIEDGRISQAMIDSKMGQSHLLELKDAPISMQHDVESFIKGGAIPSVKKLREMKKILAAPADDKKGDANGSTSTPSTGVKKDDAPSYSNGYQGSDDSQEPMTQKEKNAEDKKEAPARDPEDQYLDLINIIEQQLEDIANDTASMHGVAQTLKDQVRTKFVNEIRRDLNAVTKKLGDHFEACEDMEGM